MLIREAPIKRLAAPPRETGKSKKLCMHKLLSLLFTVDISDK